MSYNLPTHGWHGSCARCGTPLYVVGPLCNVCQLTSAVEEQNKLLEANGNKSQHSYSDYPTVSSPSLSTEEKIAKKFRELFFAISVGYLMLCWGWWFLKFVFVWFFSILLWQWQGWPEWSWIFF